MAPVLPDLAQLPKRTPLGDIVQFAWHSPDIEAAAQSWAAHAGAGPFFQLSHIPLASCLYRGAPTQFDHSSAYGQCGSVMLELIHQHGDDASVVRDAFASDQGGLHHAAVFVPDLNAAIGQGERYGWDCAMDAQTADGVRFVMLDARADYGLFIELYKPSEALTRFYGYVRYKSEQDRNGPLISHLG